MKIEKKLLRRIAAIPAGERLPLPRFAREFNCSQSVLIGMVERLITDGQIDQETLRPFEVGQAHIPDAFVAEDLPATVTIVDAITGKELAGILIAEGARRGFKRSALSVELFGGTGAIRRLEGMAGPVRKGTVAMVRAWLQQETQPHTEMTSTRAAPSGPGPVMTAEPTAEVEEGAGSARNDPAPSDPIFAAEPQTGAEWEELIRREAMRRGIPLSQWLAPFTPHVGTWLDQLKQAKRPRPRTIERIKALLADEPVEPPVRNVAGPLATARREDRASAGLPPSGRAIRDARALDLCAEQREREETARQAAERGQALRQPGETLAEAVAREAREIGERRTRARSIQTVSHVLDSAVVEEPDGDDPDVGEITAERRSRELRDIASPSALIRKATAEWPDKCLAVAAIAVQLGIQKGEAWLRVIEAGLLTISEDLKEEASA
jgi:hypothetical protein